MSGAKSLLVSAFRAVLATAVVGVIVAAQLRVTLSSTMQPVFALNAEDAKLNKDAETHAWSLEQAVVWNPNDYHALNRLGSYYLEQNNAKFAREAFDACLAQSPGHLGALVALCEMDTHVGNLERAASYAERGLAVAPTSWRMLLSAGTLAIRQRDYEKAVEILEKADNVARIEQISVYNQLSQAYLLAGNAESALATAQRSLSARKRNPEAAVIKGKALAALDRHEEAIEALQFAITYFPKRPPALARTDARLQLASAYFETGRLPEATGIVRDVVRKSPAYAQIRTAATDLCATFTERLKTMKVPQRQLAQIHCNLGYAYAAMGMLDDADQRFAAAAATGSPIHVACVWAHAETLLRLEQFEDAAARYQDAVSRGPAPIEMRLGYAAALTKAGRTSDAQLQYQLALQGYVLDTEERERIQALFDAIN